MHSKQLDVPLTNFDHHKPVLHLTIVWNPRNSLESFLLVWNGCYCTHAQPFPVSSVIDYEMQNDR